MFSRLFLLLNSEKYLARVLGYLILLLVVAVAVTTSFLGIGIMTPAQVAGSVKLIILAILILAAGHAVIGAVKQGNIDSDDSDTGE